MKSGVRLAVLGGVGFAAPFVSQSSSWLDAAAAAAAQTTGITPSTKF